MQCGALVTWLLLSVGLAAAQAPAPGLRAPAGFEVTKYADQSLANDIYTLTIDGQGRVVVAGRGFIRTLIDDDGDGKANRGIDFAHEPKDGAMGMLFEEGTLYVTGDGGLRGCNQCNESPLRDGAARKKSK